MNLQIEPWTGKLLCHLISDIAAVTKECLECLEVIYGEVKEKSQRTNVWKGSRKTKTLKAPEL